MDWVRIVLQTLCVVAILSSLGTAQTDEHSGNIGGTLRHLVHALIFTLFWLGITIGR